MASHPPLGPLYYPLLKALLIFLYSVIFSFFFPSLLPSVSAPFSERVIVEDGATWEGGRDRKVGSMVAKRSIAVEGKQQAGNVELDLTNNTFMDNLRSISWRLVCEGCKSIIVLSNFRINAPPYSPQAF